MKMVNSIAKNFDNYKQKIRQSKQTGSIIIPCAIIVIFGIFLLLPEFFNKAYIGGLDSYFHMNQFYEDAMQIEHHHFSYFISIFGFNQSGRIVNAIYGPLFSYLMGGLLLLNRNWITFNELTTLLVVEISGIGMYLFCHYLHVRPVYGTIVSCIYLMTRPLLSWVGNQEFTGIGAMLLPFIFLIGAKIAKTGKINVITLTFVMSLVVQIHFLTALTSVIVLIPYAVYGVLHSTNVKKFIIHGFEALGLSLALNCNIIGGLYEVYHGNNLIPTYPQIGMQKTGVKLLSSGITHVGLALSIALLITFIYIVFTRNHSLSKLNMGISLFFLWGSSIYFPWNFLEQHANWLGNIVQFAGRFMACFWIPFLATLAICLTRLSKHRSKASTIFAYVSLFALLFISFVPTFSYIQWLPTNYYSSNVVRYYNSVHYTTKNQSVLRNSFSSKNLGLGLSSVTKDTADYLPTTKKHLSANQYFKAPIDTDMNKYLYHNSNNFQKHLTNSGMKISWNGHSNKNVFLPFVYYNDTVVSHNGHNLNPKINLIGAMQVHQHEGKNSVDISYQSSALFKLSIAIMILAWLFLLYKFLIDENYNY